MAVFSLGGLVVSPILHTSWVVEHRLLLLLFLSLPLLLAPWMGFLVLMPYRSSVPS